MSLSLKNTFLQDEFEKIAIALVLVIDHYHINGLNIFWDILYIILYV